MIYKCKSNAKINISLKLVGIKDGYHLLNSVFIPIDLADDMEFSDSDYDEIIGFDIPMEDNIIYKTIDLIRKKYNKDKHVRVVVKKQIPIKAGLGGGSSNASFTIKALNELWHLKLSNDEKIEIASLIGSDVPFFIINAPSYVTGRGEIIEAIDIPKVNGILIFDDVAFSTKVVYDNFDKLNIEFSKNISLYNGKIDYTNDLELAIVNMDGYGIIKESLADLKVTGAIHAMLSGSGGSVFGIYDEDKINEAYDILKQRHKFVYKFKSI